jgi:hypothetical protein
MVLAIVVQQNPYLTGQWTDTSNVTAYFTNPCVKNDQAVAKKQQLTVLGCGGQVKTAKTSISTARTSAATSRRSLREKQGQFAEGIFDGRTPENLS